MRQVEKGNDNVVYHFNPRTAWAMRHYYWIDCISGKQFQSTHRVSDATWLKAFMSLASSISIHAPRERCDLCPIGAYDGDVISIHAPRERCDWQARQQWPIRSYFNPRTAWAMRLGYSRFVTKDKNFNPRTAWAMRPQIRNCTSFTCYLFYTYNNESLGSLQLFK